MDEKLEKKFNQLFEEDKHAEIVDFIEKIPESERDWQLVGWYVRSLNNCDEYERAVEVSLQYQSQGESDPLWHYRLGYAFWYLDRDEEAEASLLRAKELANEGDPVIEWIDELLEQVESYKQQNENSEEENVQSGRMMSMMCLLFEEKDEMPSGEIICNKLKEKNYKVNAEWEANDQSSRLFFLPEYTVDFDDAKGVNYQLMMLDYHEIKKEHGDELARTQFWQTPNGVELLDSCRWQVMIGDFMSSTHPPKVRAQILSDWLAIALDLFPNCKAVWFESSQNIMTAEALRNNPYEGINRIFHGAVNVRFFRVGDTEDMVVDSLGLYVFGLPDVQFHFHGLNPNNVVSMTYDIAMYQFENDLPIKDDETVAGFDVDGNIHENTRWKCQYEMALIEPKREVLDVNTGDFAAGNR